MSRSQHICNAQKRGLYTLYIPLSNHPILLMREVACNALNTDVEKD